MGVKAKACFVFAMFLVRFVFTCVSQDLDDDAASALGSGASTAKKRQYGQLMLLAVWIHGIKECFCSLCGESCFAPSPFSDSHEDDTYGGYRPWRRYCVSPGNADCKSPHAGVCLICSRVFKVLGHTLKYGTIPKFLASLKGTPDGLRGFLKSVRAYIVHVNESPDGSCRALMNKAVIEAKTTIEETERQGTRAISRRTFIMEKTFADLYAKDFDKDTMPTLDQFLVNKKIGVQSGFWLPGAVNVHLPGHFEFEDYEDTGVDFRRVHEDGCGCVISGYSGARRHIGLLGPLWGSRPHCTFRSFIACLVTSARRKPVVFLCVFLAPLVPKAGLRLLAIEV